MPEAMGSMFVHRGQQAHSWWLLPRSERWKELGPAAWGRDYSEMLRCGQGRAGTDGHRAWAWELPCPITPLESEETEVQIPSNSCGVWTGKERWVLRDGLCLCQRHSPWLILLTTLVKTAVERETVCLHSKRKWPCSLSPCIHFLSSHCPSHCSEPVS